MSSKQKTFSLQTKHFIIWAGILVLFGIFVRAVEPILLPFVLGTLMAYLFDPLADRFERHGISRGLAAATITLSFFSALVALIAWIAPLLYTQLFELIDKIPIFLSAVEDLVREKTVALVYRIQRLTDGHVKQAMPEPKEVVVRAVSVGRMAAANFLTSSMAVLNLLSLLLITPIVSFYLLRDWDKVVAKLDALLPRAYADTIRAQANEVSATLAGYLRGQLYVMLILSLSYIILFSLVGLHYALLVGLLAGTLVIIPYIGTWVAAGIGLTIAYDQFGISNDFWAVVAIFVVVQLVESQILTPKVIGDRVGLHPLWLLFGMLAGAVLIGFAGVLLAVPLTAVIAVAVRFVISIYLQSPLYKSK